MGYTWTNSSWQMMEIRGMKEMAYSKLARARSNCYKDGGYDENAYRGSHHRNRHYTHRSQMGIGNFSSRAKTFDRISYEDCCENGPYDVPKGYHGSHDYSDQNCGREVNYEGLIGENDYFLVNMVVKEEGIKSWKVENFMSTFPYHNFEVFEFEKYKVYSSFPNAFDSISKVYFKYHYPFKEETFQIHDFLDLIFEFGEDTSFYHHLPFKDIIDYALFGEFPRQLFLCSFILNFFSKSFEGIILSLDFKCFQNFLCLISNSVSNLSFMFHYPFKEVLEDIFDVIELLDVHGFNCIIFEGNVVKLGCSMHRSSLNNLLLNFHAYTSFEFHRLFEECLIILIYFVLK
ncbi:hypothetical protein M9H77_17595 [Catharanthus roseus]|uniref:Uncharacterized protein n=1 Tax=Catharanthus roseus TaxID=4058 RepID=A0ACC0B522_CATRO|nr:hypothetical protein M9H77_17595 [Catharanthus roseus]